MKSVVLWQDRLRFRQYIKGKTHKYGVKFYKLCESDGLLLRSVIYSDFPRTWHPWLRTNWSNCPQIDGRFPAKRMVSFCRQFYNSVKLAKHLSKQKHTFVELSMVIARQTPKALLKRSWRKKNLCVKGAMMLLFVSGRINATCWPFLINTVLKWPQYPTNAGSSPPSPELYIITIMVCQE